MRIRTDQCPECLCTLNDDGYCSWCSYTERDELAPLYRTDGSLFEPVDMSFDEYRAVAEGIRSLTMDQL